jgi:hypothetical protein
MRKFTIPILLCVALMGTPAAAQEDARILKGDPRVPTHHPAPEGWGMQSLPISPELLADIDDGRQARKKMFIAATYSSIGKPNISGGIDAFDVMPLSFSKYWQGVVLFNMNASSKNVTVRVKATGASRQTISGNFNIPGGSVVLITGQFNAFGSGVVYLKTTATGAKAVTTALCSGC